jgi:hypothetical protein
VATGMGGMAEMSDFYNHCLESLYPPGMCSSLGICNIHTYNCFFQAVDTACCDQGTNCAAGNPVPNTCPVGCALVFPEFLETCRSFIAADPARANSLPIMEQFEVDCLHQDGLALVQYAIDMVARGCILDLEQQGHRRRQLQAASSPLFLSSVLGTETHTAGCTWDDLDDRANHGARALVSILPACVLCAWLAALSFYTEISRVSDAQSIVSAAARAAHSVCPVLQISALQHVPLPFTSSMTSVTLLSKCFSLLVRSGA